MEEDSRPSTRRPTAKAGKTEVKFPKREKEDVTKTDVVTCTRMDTPSVVGGAVGTRFNFARDDKDGVIEDEEPADHGDSDGEG